MTDLTTATDSEILNEYFKRFQQPKKNKQPHLSPIQEKRIDDFLAKTNARREPNFVLLSDDEAILNHPYLRAVKSFGL